MLVHSNTINNLLLTVAFINTDKYKWLSGVVVRASDFRSRGCQFDSRLFHCRV